MNQLKRYLPPIMRNQFWNAMMDSIEDEIDLLKTTYIDTIKTLYSLSDSSKEELIDVGSTIYQLDSFMLGRLFEFLKEIELYNTDDEAFAEARALERLRQEIMKIPFLMSKRGTLEYYTAILEFCGFNYEGVITLTKTSGDVRVSPIYTNVDLIPYDSDTTRLIVPKVSEDFSGSEDIVFAYLDQEVSDPENPGQFRYETLDSEDYEIGDELRRPILDLTSASSLDTVNLYRKILMIALVIENTSAMYYSSGEVITADYPGAPTFPENLGRYYQSFINLNRRATDVLLFGPMLALNIVRSDIAPFPTGSIAAIPDTRLVIYDPIESVPNSSVGFRIKYYEERMTNEVYNPETGETTYSLRTDLTPFYEENIYNVVHTPASEATDTEPAVEETLVLLGMCSGELNRHPVDFSFEGPEEAPTGIKFRIPKSDWSSSMVFRLSTEGGPQYCYLLHLDSYGNINQTVNTTTSSVDLTGTVSENEDMDYNIITIHNTTPDGAVPSSITDITYLSQHLHTAVRTIQLLSYDSSDQETEIVRMEFRYNTQIELCSGITLFTYLNIHFDGPFDPTKVISEDEEAF